MLSNAAVMVVHLRTVQHVASRGLGACNYHGAVAVGGVVGSQRTITTTTAPVIPSSLKGITQNNVIWLFTLRALSLSIMQLWCDVQTQLIGQPCSHKSLLNIRIACCSESLSNSNLFYQFHEPLVLKGSVNECSLLKTMK